MKLTDKMDIKALDVSELSDENLDFLKRLVNMEKDKRVREDGKPKLSKNTVKSTKDDTLSTGDILSFIARGTKSTATEALESFNEVSSGLS